MARYVLEYSLGHKNSYKGCYTSNANIIRVGTTKCLVGYSQDFKLKRDAIEQGKIAIAQLKQDYARELLDD